MKIKFNLFYLFLAVIVVQLCVPGMMIYSHETALKQGKAFKFNTAPVDPFDPFRGRYVTLNIAANSAPWANNVKIKKGAWAYVTVVTGDDGFAELIEASTTPPAHSHYLRLKARRSYSGKVHFTLPFNRYYAEETLAPEIERSFGRSQRRSREKTYVMVRVYNGTGVIEELYLDDLPVMQFIEREAKKAKS